MSEQVPTGQSALEKERARLASERAKLDHKENILNIEEGFGKYDQDVTPAEGEMTYQQYLAQRPAEGVVRDGEGFRDAQSGQFASHEVYEAQKVSSQDHYDKVGGLVNTGEYQPPNYEEMGVVQLAKEAARARALGDVANEKEIRAAVEHYLTMDAMKDDTETAEEAQDRYDAEIARFDSLVERFENLRASMGKESVAPQPAEAVESQPVEAVTPAEAQAAPEAEVEEVAAPEEAPAAEEVHAPEAAPASSPDLLYNGEKVSVRNVFESPDGKKVVEVIGADGESHLIYEHELAYNAPAKEEPEPEGPRYRVDGDNTWKIPTVVPEEEVKGKELVPFGAEHKQLVPVPEEEPEAEKLSRWERTKNWFAKEKANYQKYGGKAYWGEKWTQSIRGFKDHVLDYGVDDDMTEEEKEHTRKRNRVILLVGVGAIAATSIGLAIAHANAVHHVAGGVGSTGGHEGTVPDVGGAGAPRPSAETGVKDLPFNAGSPGVETVPSGAEASAISPEAFNIPRGLGGEELFKNLGIDPSKWYNNENSLLARFPQDLYRMRDGHVGISHSGMLTQGLQDAIKSIKG